MWKKVIIFLRLEYYSIAEWIKIKQHINCLCLFPVCVRSIPVIQFEPVPNRIHSLNNERQKKLFNSINGIENAHKNFEKIRNSLRNFRLIFIQKFQFLQWELCWQAILNSCLFVLTVSTPKIQCIVVAHCTPLHITSVWCWRNECQCVVLKCICMRSS